MQLWPVTLCKHSVFAGFRQMRGKPGNILDSIVNICVAAKYPWHLRQRFIKYEDRNIQPSTRWGLAEHDQIIYRSYRDYLTHPWSKLWTEQRQPFFGRKERFTQRYSALLYKGFQAPFYSSTPLQVPRKAGWRHRQIFWLAAWLMCAAHLECPGYNRTALARAQRCQGARG